MARRSVWMGMAVIAAVSFACTDATPTPTDGHAEPTSTVDVTVDGVVTLSPETPGLVAVDDLSGVWIVEQQEDHAVISSLADTGHLAERRVDTGSGEHTPSPALYPFDGGVVLATVQCLDQNCDRATLLAEHFVRDGAEISTRHRWPSTATSARPSGIGLAGADGAVTAVRSGDVVALPAGDASGDIAVPSRFGDPCFIDGELVVTEYDSAADPSPTQPSTLPPNDAPITGRLRSHGEDGWSVLASSEFRYTVGDFLEPRCTRNGLELTEGQGLARTVWDGSGAWQRNDNATPVEWALLPQEDAFGLVGVVATDIVRVDSVTGDVLASVAVPEAHRYGQNGRVAFDQMAIGRGAHPTAVGCSTGPADGPGTYRCEVFRG